MFYSGIDPKLKPQGECLGYLYHQHLSHSPNVHTLSFHFVLGSISKGVDTKDDDISTQYFSSPRVSVHSKCRRLLMYYHNVQGGPGKWRGQLASDVGPSSHRRGRAATGGVELGSRRKHLKALAESCRFGGKP